MRAALASLSPTDASCLLLIIVYDFTAAEIGQIIVASPEAVAKRFSRQEDGIHPRLPSSHTETLVSSIFPLDKFPHLEYYLFR